MTAKFIIGDTRDVTASLPDGSVDLILTSPPFLALRSYLPADHPDKHREIGSEPDPAAFLDVLLDLTVEWRRVLAPHGSICIELGDTYSGSGGAGGDYAEGGQRDGQRAFDGSARRTRPVKASPDKQSHRDMGDGVVAITGGRGWPMPKSLCFMPQLYGASLAYGRNLLNGRTIEPWRVRNVVRWCRPNPPVGALGDKFRPATSEMTIACFDNPKRPRYFDLDAVRTPLTEPGAVKKHSTEQRNASVGWKSNSAEIRQNEAGAPPLDWWEISTESYAGSHYATWPRKLLTRPILAMCPQRVCTVCGEPSRRITSEPAYEPSATNRGGVLVADAERVAEGVNQWRSEGGANASVVRSVETLGWTDCGHDSWRNGVVLDPFAGSGTTLAVATGHGRDAIGIDIDERNADLAIERVGMFLAVEHHSAEHVA